MAILSTHKGLHVWLKRNGYVGKKSSSLVVDKIVQAYKKDTGNDYKFVTGYQPDGRNQKQFKEITEYVKKNYIPSCK